MQPEDAIEYGIAGAICFAQTVPCITPSSQLTLHMHGLRTKAMHRACLKVLFLTFVICHADGIVQPRQKVIDTVKKPEMFDKVRLTLSTYSYASEYL